MRAISLIGFVALLLVASARSENLEGKEPRVLAIFETVAFSSAYSQYLDRIKEQGYVIERRSALDPTLHLREWDTWKYDKLIIFASGIKGDFGVQHIAPFCSSC